MKRARPAKGGFPQSVLVLVAHPDDEVIFFGGLILRLVAKGSSVLVVCVTSRFSPPQMTSIRAAEFRRACWWMGARARLLGLLDSADRLPIDELTAQLQIIASRYRFEAVYTHGIWGEYGHPHHRDVCLAAHRIFGNRVFSLAGPLPAVQTIALTPAALDYKRRIAADAYYSQPFASEWCSSVERFARLTLFCAEKIYQIDDDDRSCFPLRSLSNHMVRDVIRRSLDAFRSSSIPFPEVGRIPTELWRPRYGRWVNAIESALCESSGTTGRS